MSTVHGVTMNGTQLSMHAHTKQITKLGWNLLVYAFISNYKEISSGCSLEGLILKLKLQYFGHLMLRADSFEKTLMLGKIVGRRRREGDDRG